MAKKVDEELLVWRQEQIRLTGSWLSIHKWLCKQEEQKLSSKNAKPALTAGKRRPKKST